MFCNAAPEYSRGGPLVRPLQLISLTAAGLWLTSAAIRATPGSGIILLCTAVLFAMLASCVAKMPQKYVFARPLGTTYQNSHPFFLRLAVSIFGYL
jgi:hypothetical protein